MTSIPEPLLCRQAWNYYVCLLAWPLYLFLIPAAYRQWGWWSVPLMVFPGAWLFTWVAMLMHEAWHRYVPGLPHDFFYYTFAFLLITDPQVYRLVHGSHHAEVNSWEDVEFHPLGEIRRPVWRRLYNLMEIVFGNIFLQLVTGLVVPFHPRFRERYRAWLTLASLLVWAAFLCGLGLSAQRLFGLSLADVVIPYLLSYYLGSLALHHSQLVEHGNLCLDGDWQTRNIRTRNLAPHGILEKLFLFLTHNDSREHVLHHTQVRVYSRPFPGLVPLPPEAVCITLKDYLLIIWGMVRD